MKILPIYQNTPTVVFGAFMEGNLPNPLNYDPHTVFNNMVSGRTFLQSVLGNGQQQLLPGTTSLQSSPFPAWTTAQGYRGKRVMPKVTLPSYSTSYQELINTPLVNVSYQLDVLFMTILTHRVASTSNATLLPCGTPPNTAVLPAPKQNSDGTWLIAEYDFGADIVLSSLSSMTFTNTATNVLISTAANMVVLQMLQGSTWTDVTSLTTNLAQSATSTEKNYQLPATVQARKFRIVSKAATNVYANGIGAFALHFYGDYVSGSSPRTLGKVQHAVLMPYAYGTSYGAPAMSIGQASQSFGRLFPHYGLTITDDLKQVNSFDMLISDATVTPGQEQAVSAITITYKPVITEAY